MRVPTKYTTPVAPTAWVLWGVRALAVLLGVGVVIAGVLYTLGQSPSGRAPADGESAPARGLIANCRVCRDEALAAQQPAQAKSEPTSLATSLSPQAPALITTCRVCRDEALGSNQAYLTTPAHLALLPQPTDPRQHGPR